MSDYKNIDITVLQAKMDREVAIARELNDTPITEGSPKQIDWAMDIRWRKADAAAKVIRQIEDNKLDDPEMTAKQQKSLIFINKHLPIILQSFGLTMIANLLAHTGFKITKPKFLNNI